MYPIIALIVLTLFTWIVATGASWAGNEEAYAMEKPERNSDDHDHRKAA